MVPQSTATSHEGEPPGDEDPPTHPFGRRPAHAPVGDFASPPDSDDAESLLPRTGEHPQINWTASATPPPLTPGPVDPEDVFSSKSNSTESSGDQLVSDVPLAQRPRDDSRKDADMDYLLTRNSPGACSSVSIDLEALPDRRPCRILSIHSVAL